MLDIANNITGNNDTSKWVKYGGIAVGITTAVSLLSGAFLDLLETSYDDEAEAIIADIRNLKNEKHKEELLTEIGVSKPTQAAMKVEEILVDTIDDARELYDAAKLKNDTEDMLQYYRILSQATRDLADIYGGSRV